MPYSFWLEAISNLPDMMGTTAEFSKQVSHKNSGEDVQKTNKKSV